MVPVSIDLECEMGYDTKITGTASEDSKEQVRIGVFCHRDFLSIVVNHLDDANVVTEESKGACQLAKAACLDVATEVDLGALTCKSFSSIGL